MDNTLSVAGKKTGKLLIIDDNPITLHAMAMALCDDFDIEEAESGEEGLRLLRTFEPDLVLLDIEMEGIDGFETCRLLRQKHRMPVIFVSSHDSLEERLKAFDSGGDDFIVKPFDAEVLHRKIHRMVAMHAHREQLAEEKDAAQQIAMDFLKSVGETGVLLNFMRSSLGCMDYADLATRLLEAARNYGVNCHVQVRHADGAVSMTPHGIATPLEASILDQSIDLGRIFQFKRRLVVNYDLVSILVQDLPEDEVIAGRLRDNTAILAENAEAIAETIGVRKEAALRAAAMQAAAADSHAAVETLREMYLEQQGQIRQSLDGLMKQMEDKYLFLALTDIQETSVSDTIRRGSSQILDLFAHSGEFERQFSSILASLRLNKADEPQI